MRSKSLALLLALPLLLAATTAAAQADATKRTQDLIAAFKTVKPVPKGGKALSPADQKANQAAFKTLDGFLAYDRIIGATIDPHAKHFKPEQLKTFKEGFTTLIRLIAYPDSGSFFEEAKVTFGKPKKKGDRIDLDLDALMEKEDMETTVTFHWETVGDALRIVDVSFDESSLVLDYRNQFGRILEKEGVDGLMKRLNAKLKETREATKGLLP